MISQSEVEAKLAALHRRAKSHLVGKWIEDQLDAIKDMGLGEAIMLLNEVERKLDVLDEYLGLKISRVNTPEDIQKYAHMSAEGLAGEYSEGIARIIATHAQLAVEMMDGPQYAVDAAARKAAEILRERASSWTANLSEDVAEILAKGAESSESPLDVAAELVEAGSTHAETVARTEMARARESANLDIMKAQNVEKVQFLASEDERMCPICGQYHEQIFDVDKAPVLPLHPNCRCTLVPYAELD